MYFQEYNCFLILNVCQGVRVTDAVTYSQSKQRIHSEKITGEDLRVCLHVSVNGEGGFTM